MSEKYGYLREHSSLCDGVDEVTGLHRTGLDEYLSVIYPNIHDWTHNKSFGEHNGTKYKIRPDYRSEELKMIVEFDGLPHHMNPSTIIKDKINSKIYTDNGYKLVRIPYFVQLAGDAVFGLFGVKVKENLFNIIYPSIGGCDLQRNPSYLCYNGLKRMAKEFKMFPEQFEININSLKNINNDELSGVNELLCGCNRKEE